MKSMLIIISAILLLVVPCRQTTARTLPYLKSSVLVGFEWTSQPHRFPGTHSDMHWETWASDDAIYCIDGDGRYFNSPSYFASLIKVTGTPPDHKIELVTQFRQYPIREATRGRKLRRYLCSPLSVDSTLYACLYDYDWNLPGLNPDDANDRTIIDAYSKHAGIAGIIVSNDMGKNWRNIPGPNDHPFFGQRYANLHFVNFGPGYTDVPQELGDYVYGISNDKNWESGDNLFLARVPRNKMLDRSAWEFFAGQKEGRPLWSKNEDDSQPVFTDPGHVGHSCMSFNKPLGRYLLAVFSDTCPHRENASLEEVLANWDATTELQIYEGEKPWGPWFLVYNENPWEGPQHAPYLPHLPTKWFSKDGLSGTMIYSGDWVHAKHPKGEYYAFMMRSFRLIKKR